MTQTLGIDSNLFPLQFPNRVKFETFIGVIKNDYTVYHYGVRPFIKRALTSFCSSACNQNSDGGDLYHKALLFGFTPDTIYCVEIFLENTRINKDSSQEFLKLEKP